MNDVLVARDLQFSYDANRVIHDLSFGVGEEEMAGILGRNGSGKTTLLRLFAGWLEPERGEVQIFGRSVRTLGHRERARKLAMLSQLVDLSIETGVREMVLLGRAPYLGRFEEARPADVEAGRWAMEMTDTWKLRGESMHSLSAGERQRVMISRALAQETPILLLDEPTTSLDIAHQRMIMDNLSWLRKEKHTTIVFVSHDVNLASRYADRILLLGEGRRVACGTASEALTRPHLKTTYGVDLVIEERAGRKIILEWEDGEKRAPWNQ